MRDGAFPLSCSSSLACRYNPYFANSGFYYLRANDRTQHLMYRMLQSFDAILTFRSHQHVLDQQLIEHTARFGLSVAVLPKDAFPQGQVFHHNKAQMQQYVDGELKPYVFHMCWTANEENKLKYLKNLGLWFLKPTCSEDAFREEARAAEGNHLTLDECCAATPAWAPNPDYVSAIDLTS